MIGGQRLALAATWMAAAATVALMTLTEHFRIVLTEVSSQVDSETMGVMAVLGEIVLVCVTLVIATVVAQLAFGQAVAELRREIALRRLIGSRRRAERRALFGRFALTGLVGAAAGFATGALVAVGATALLQSAYAEWDAAALPVVQQAAVIPAAGVALGAVIAAWGASRQVLGVAPLEALGESDVDSAAVRPERRTGRLIALGAGVAILAAGAVMGLFTPLAVLVGVIGGAVTVFAIVSLATPLTASLVRGLRVPLGTSTVGRSAYGSLLRSPHRVGGITVALMVGVACVTMFSVAGETAQRALLAVLDADIRADQQAALMELTAQLMTVIAAAVACGSLVAVFGFMATMLMSVRARTREIALMRLVGMRARQARQLMALETAAITIMALVGGVVLGVTFGWLGTFMLLGSIPYVGAVVPVVPPLLLPALTAAVALVGVAAAVPAARRASGIPPLAAVAAS